MKKRTKKLITVAALVIIIPIAIFYAGVYTLAYINDRNYEKGQYILNEGPFSDNGKWVSLDNDSYLVCEMPENGKYADITAYFTVNGEYIPYEVNCINTVIYLSALDDVDGYTGNMEFDGNEFVIKKLYSNSENKRLEIKKYVYTKNPF